MKSDYTLSFHEATERCLHGEGYIRGHEFAPGFYIKRKDGELIVVNGNGFHQERGLLHINRDVQEQRFKLFIAPTQKELELE